MTQELQTQVYFFGGPMRVFAYLWLSPHLKEEERAHLRDIRGEALHQWCEEQGYDWQELCCDSALQERPEQRPLLKRLLKGLQTQDILLVQSLSDLGRRFHDAYALMQLFRQSQSQGQLLALDENLRINRSEGHEMLVVLSQIPQLQSPETQSAQAQAYKRSEVSRQNGGACPYGYSIHPVSNEYQIIPEEAQVVRQIFKKRARGQSLRQIAQTLTHQGKRTKRGGRWQANTIKAITENPFYMGVYQTHYATFENHHPHIISESLFYELNAPLICDDIAL